MKGWMTKIQVNALISLGSLTIMGWKILDIIHQNNLETAALQLLGAALMAIVGGVVYVCRVFAEDPKKEGEEDDKTRKNGA